jgi:hypothetical protein
MPTSDGGVNYYNVPDSNSGLWLPSRPRKHANAINERDKECGYRLKPLIRIVKKWSKEHSDLMESYHIEVLCLSIFDEDMSDYSWEVFRFFDAAVNLVSAPLAYEAGHADDYLGSEQRREVVKRLETARDKAREAWYLTFNGRTDDEKAVEIWRQIFGDKFPVYG